jgi:putative transcriptional regulator
MPEHGHGGEELTLVLEGAYSDKLGRFAAGDIADLGDDVEHQPVVDQDRACICLVATEAPTRFRSWPARILQPLIGI